MSTRRPATPLRTPGPDPAEGPGLSVGRLADATGIPAATLRVWERRYGRPRARRLESGHRRYPPSTVPWLRLVAEGLALGHRPGELVALSDQDLEETLARAAANAPPAAHPRVPAWLDEVRRFRWAAVRADLEEELSRGLLPFLEGTLEEFLSELGREWARGGLTVRHEHFASEELRSFLGGLRRPVEGARPVLLASLPGERHGLALAMLELVCDEARIPVRNLGVDVPVAEIGAAAEELRARGVALTLSLAGAGPASAWGVREVRASLPRETPLVIGGAGARRGAPGRGVLRPRTLADFQELCAGWRRS